MSDFPKISGPTPQGTELPNVVSQEQTAVRTNASEVGALNTADPPVSQLGSGVEHIQDPQNSEPRLTNLQPQVNVSPQVQPISVDRLLPEVPPGHQKQSNDALSDVPKQPIADLPKKEYPDVLQPSIQVDPSVSRFGQKQGLDVPPELHPQKLVDDPSEKMGVPRQEQTDVPVPTLDVSSPTDLISVPKLGLDFDRLPPPPTLTAPQPPPPPLPHFTSRNVRQNQAPPPLPHFPASKIRQNQAPPTLPPFPSRMVWQARRFVKERPPLTLAQKAEKHLDNVAKYLFSGKGLGDGAIQEGVFVAQVGLAPQNLKNAHNDLSQFTGSISEQLGTNAAGELGSVLGFAADAYNLRGLVRERHDARELRSQIQKTSEEYQRVTTELSRVEARLGTEFEALYKKELQDCKQLKSLDPLRAGELEGALAHLRGNFFNRNPTRRRLEGEADDLKNKLRELEAAMLLANDPSAKEIGVQGVQTFLSGSNTGSYAFNIASGAFTALSNVAGITSGTVSVVSMPFDAREAKNNIQDAKKFKTIRARVKLEIGKLNALSQQVRTPREKEEDLEDRAFLVMLKRKLPVTEKLISFGTNVTKVQLGTAAGATLGVKIAVAAGVTGTAVGVAGAVLTPVGATLAGAAGIGALGYGGYKVGRYNQNKGSQLEYAKTITALTKPGNPLDGTPKGAILLADLKKNQPALFDQSGNALDPRTVKQEMLNLASAGFMRHNSKFALSVMTNRIASEYDPRYYDSSAKQYNGGNLPRTWALMKNLGVKDEVLMHIAEEHRLGNSQAAEDLLRKFLKIA